MSFQRSDFLDHRAALFTCCAWVGAVLPLGAVDSGDTPATRKLEVGSPLVQEASAKGVQAVSGLRLPDGVKASLWATEPLFADPVAMSFEAGELATHLGQSRQRRCDASVDALRDYRMTLTGGNADRGRRLFHEKVEFLCVRCHRVEGQGVSTVGPDLTGIGTQRDREYLLRAIVNPGADIATGFEFATLQLKDGSTVVGIIRQESAIALQVEVAEAGAMKQREVLKTDIKQRASTSAMPPLVSLMSRQELRDLVEYVATQTTTPSKPKNTP